MLNIMASVVKGANVPSSHSLYDYLVALGPLSIPIAVALILIAFVLVALGLVEVDFGGGGLSMKLQRPKKGAASTSYPEKSIGTVENVSASPDLNPSIEVQAVSSVSEAAVAEAANEGTGLQYFFAKDLNSLDKYWPEFRDSLEIEELELWETSYRRRRATFGADHGREAVEQLTKDHPAWAYPFSILIDLSCEEGDYHQAESYFLEGVKRESSNYFENVLYSGLKLRFLEGGLNVAAEFCFTWVKAKLPERVKSMLFINLANLLKENGDLEGYRIIYEWAILLCPSNRSQAFPLAYSYGESISHWMAALSSYEWVLENEENRSVAFNNMAVCIGLIDKAAQIDGYEKAIEGGDKFASANLAKLLIEDGYIKAGERLLASVNDLEGAAELHASAVSAAHAARRALEAKNKKIDMLVSKQIAPFRQAISRSFRHFQKNFVQPTGAFVSKDNLVQIFFEENYVKCLMNFGGFNYSGILKWEISCYAGRVTESGGSIFSKSFEVTLLDFGGGILSLFKWPNSVGLNETLTSWELHYTVHDPLPLPTSSNLPQANALSGLLLGNQSGSA